MEWLVLNVSYLIAHNTHLTCVIGGRGVAGGVHGWGGCGGTLNGEQAGIGHVVIKDEA